MLFTDGHFFKKHKTCQLIYIIMKERRDSDQFCQYHRNMFGRSLNYFDINENRKCKTTNGSLKIKTCVVSIIYNFN